MACIGFPFNLLFSFMRGNTFDRSVNCDQSSLLITYKKLVSQWNPFLWILRIPVPYEMVYLSMLIFLNIKFWNDPSFTTIMILFPNISYQFRATRKSITSIKKNNWNCLKNCSTCKTCKTNSFINQWLRYKDLPQRIWIIVS